MQTIFRHERLQPMPDLEEAPLATFPNMTYSQAIAEVWKGKRVARPHWKDFYLVLVTGTNTNAVCCSFSFQHDGGDRKYGVWKGRNPEDRDATDWQIVEEE